MYMLLLGIIVFATIISGILVLLIFLRLIDINNFFKTNTFKRRSEGFSDLLQYDTVIEDGIILLKNGSLMSGFYYKAQDMSEMSRDDQDVMTARISKAIFELGTGWTVNFDAIRLESRTYPERAFSAFDKPVSYAIDEERRKLFSLRDTMFTTENFLTVTYTPPTLVTNKIIDMMYTSDESGEKISYYDKNLIHYKNKLKSFVSILSTIFKIEQLGRTSYMLEDGSMHTRDIFLEFLHYCATGKVQAINVPKNIDIPLDSIICGEDFITGIYPKMGNFFISAVAIDGFPAESYPTILNKLSDIPVTTRFSTRFICIDKLEAEKKLETIKKRWQQKQRGMMQVILNQPQTDTNTNWDAVEMTNDAIEGITLQNSERAIFGYYTANIILMEEKQEILEKWSLEIKKVISSLGFNARIETINTVEAYLGSLPGHTIENVNCTNEGTAGERIFNCDVRKNGVNPTATVGRLTYEWIFNGEVRSGDTQTFTLTQNNYDYPVYVTATIDGTNISETRKATINVPLNENDINFNCSTAIVNDNHEDALKIRCQPQYNKAKFLNPSISWQMGDDSLNLESSGNAIIEHIYKQAGIYNINMEFKAENNPEPINISKKQTVLVNLYTSTSWDKNTSAGTHSCSNGVVKTYRVGRTFLNNFNLFRQNDFDIYSSFSSGNFNCQGQSGGWNKNEVNVWDSAGSEFGTFWGDWDQHGSFILCPKGVSKDSQECIKSSF